MKKSSYKVLLGVLLSTCSFASESKIIASNELREGKMERVLEKIEINEDDLSSVLSQLGLTLNGSSTMPKEGRIATNLVVPTLERGDVLIRAYPEQVAEKLETGIFGFEVRVLSHLSQHGLRVPSPLDFKNGTPLLKHKNHIYMVYPFIPGQTLEKDDLSLDVAQKSGKFVSEMVQAAVKYQPKENEDLPEGDLDHLRKCYEKQSNKFTEILDTPTFQEMRSFIDNDDVKGMIEASPKGIVHSDFFFENFVVDKEETAAIDFGDAYYGSVVMDIAIAAMEFSAVEDQEWNFEYIREFLKPNISWLSTHGFDAKKFIDVMKVNCLRFAIYTTPFTLDEGESLANNPYVLRFQYLKNAEVISNIEKIFNENKL